MPSLSNPRHERFAQELAKGETADAAYAMAGYAENRCNASRLKANENIQRRVAEIQERGAIRAELTIESLTQDLTRLAKAAEGMNSESGMQAARACLMDAAKLNGLVVDKKVTAETTVEDMLEQIHKRRGSA